MTPESNVAKAYRYCEHLAFTHYENFPVASFLLPREKRRHVATLYAFARIADDLADEPGIPDRERLQKLGEWRRQLADCYQGSATHPVFTALGRTVAEYEIPQSLLLRLLNAFTSDVTVKRYETFEDVLAYCRNSANPVGRVILLLFGYRDDRHAEWSDHICTALQLANFWQDLSIDLPRGRLYIPMEDIRRFGVAMEELTEQKQTDAFRRMMEFEVGRTDELFERGRPLLGAVGRDLSLELKLTWHGGRRVLEKIRQSRYGVLQRRPVLTLMEKSMLFFKALGPVTGHE